MVDKSKGKGTEIWAHPENDTSVQLTFPFGVLYATLFPIISFSNSFLYFNTIYKFFLLCYPPLFVNRKNNGVPYFYNDESAHLTLLILILHSNLSQVSLFPIHLISGLRLGDKSLSLQFGFSSSSIFKNWIYFIKL